MHSRGKEEKEAACMWWLLKEGGCCVFSGGLVGREAVYHGTAQSRLVNTVVRVDPFQPLSRFIGRFSLSRPRLASV